MTKTLASADWLTASDTQTVMAALEAARPDGARFVGGCVRNSLMGRPIDDIDIATQLKPQETLAALAAAGIRAIPTGIEHGTVTAIVDGTPFEITSLRRDVETDGRRAVVAFTQDWAEDAMRRDFRLNAIYADAAGKLYDPTGHGIEDAAKARVVFIGDADQRLREDYLRILRFFRFNAWYGGEIDAEGLAACKRQKDGLEKIAAERIWKEFKKMLGAPDPESALEAMEASGVFHQILPQRSGIAELHDLKVAEMLTRQAPDPMQRLMALLGGATDIENVIEAMKMSNVEAARLQLFASAEVPANFASSGKVLRRNLYLFGAQALIDRSMLSAKDARDVVAACLSWARPIFPLKGEDLLKSGMSPGPEMGKWLKTLENWWIEGDFQADKPALLEELERQLKAD